MINRKQFRLLVWLVIILLALNLSAIGTILWMRFTGPIPGREPGECSYPLKKKHFRMHDEIIKNEVGFDEKQLESFRQLREKHFTEIREITSDIEKTRELQFKTIRDNNADPDFTDSLSKRTGDLHHKWAVSSARFLNAAKDLCTPEQHEKLFRYLEKSRIKHGYKSHNKKYRDDSLSGRPCDGYGSGGHKEER